eukprot:GHVS01023160.1.p1 GENE.GHVS01023160.1~~GHVS01023160.1.p1  ORF type:complete len:675 (-),score=145.69 GHVS01023160.1:486-2510(-)
MSFAPCPPPVTRVVSSSVRVTRQSPFGLPPKPRPVARRGRAAASENQMRLDNFCKRGEGGTANGVTDEPELTEQQPQHPPQSFSQQLPAVQQPQPPQQPQQPPQPQQHGIQEQLQRQPVSAQSTVGRGGGSNRTEGSREPRSEQRAGPPDAARLQRLVERQQKEIESLRSTMEQCLTGLMECQGRLATIEKERNEERRQRENDEEMRHEGEEECDRMSFVSSKSKTTPIRSPIKITMESTSFTSSVSFASQAKSATAAGSLGRPVYPENHCPRQDSPSSRVAACSSSCSAVGQPMQESKETARRSNSCAALRRPVAPDATAQSSSSRKNNKRSTSARPSINDSHLREIKRHAGTDVTVLRHDVEDRENAPPATVGGQDNSTPRPCCSGRRDTQKTPVNSSPVSCVPGSSFQNYHKAKKPLPNPTELNADVSQKIALHTLRCCKHSISTASAHNNFAVQSYFQRLEKSIKESIDKKTGSVIGPKPEQRAQANKNVDEFSVFGAPPAFVAGDVFSQLDYSRLSDQSKKGHKLMSFVESRGFDIYYGTEMARVVAMQQMSIKAARGNFPEAAAWGVKANVDERSPPPGNEEYMFSDLVDEYFSSDKLEKNNRLNWRQHPVSDEHKQWVRNYMNMNVSLANLVYDPEVCFCPTPDPLVKWQWNFKKQPNSQAQGKKGE